jgi:drug/metabolite transporter (DMT)-like permease
MSSLSSREWKILLILVAASWGVGFPMTKDAIEQVPIYSFLFIRFGIAALCFLPWILPHVGSRLFWRDFLFGFGVGVPLYVGYVLQTLGLSMTSVTHTAFLTGLYSIFTPLLEWLIYRKKPSLGIMIACGLAIAGLWMISGMKDFRLNGGDFLVVLCALSFSFQILWLAHTPKTSSSTHLAFSQLAAISLLSLPTSLLLESPQWSGLNVSIWSSILFMAVIGSAAAFFIQTAAQKVIAPTHVALFLLTEPLWGALAGAILSHERLAWTSYAGGALLLLAIFISEIRLENITPKRNTQ